MKGKKNAVMKALSPEDKEIIANIQALVNQLMQMGAGAEGEVVAESDDMDEDDINKGESEDELGTDEKAKKEEDEKEAAKKAVKKEEPVEGDNADGNDDAEDKLADLPESASNNIEEVAKMLATILSGKSVKKSAPVNPMVNTMDKIAKALGQIAERQEMTENAVIGILEGLGVSNEIKKSVKQERPKPVEYTDGKNVLEFLAKALGEHAPEKKSEPVGKMGLGGVMKSLARDAGDLWNINKK